ncbi:MAG: DUF308 domain-containing protein [Ardenticatenaceae bacterium]|nr:DUF308 domain-containing protein [Ardenticatenaceae bacterium]
MSLFDQEVNRLMSPTWWVMLLRGLAAIAAGILLVFQTNITLMIIVLFLGGYLLVGGIFAIVGAFLHRQADPRWWLDVVIGVLGVLAGIFVLLNPSETLQMAPELIVYILAAVVLITGVLEISKALTGGKGGSPNWSGVALGVLYIVSAGCLLLLPNMAIGIIFYAFSIVLIFIGLILVYYAFTLRR